MTAAPGAPSPSCGAPEAGQSILCHVCPPTKVPTKVGPPNYDRRSGRQTMIGPPKTAFSGAIAGAATTTAATTTAATAATGTAVTAATSPTAATTTALTTAPTATVTLTLAATRWPLQRSAHTIHHKATTASIARPSTASPPPAAAAPGTARTANHGVNKAPPPRCAPT